VGFQNETSETNEYAVTFKGELLGTMEVTSSQLILYIEQWITINGHVVVQGVCLRVHNTCPVEIRDFSDPLCPSSAPTTAVIVGVTVAIITVLVVIAVIAAVLIFVAVRKRKH